MKSKKECTVYIDESGDLGFQKGTRWFVLSGVIVNKEDEPEIRKRLARIRSTLNLQTIHLNKLQDFSKRAYVVRELKDCPFTYVNIIIDTQKMDSNKIPTPGLAYNYCCKYLLQRISWYMRDNDCRCGVVLSARGTKRDNELIAYIKDKLLPFEHNSIDSQYFGKIEAKSAPSWDLLQLADVCATTTFLAHEKNSLGFIFPCFAMALSAHLYRAKGKIDTHGIKYFTKEMRPEGDELKKARPCYLQK